MHNVPTPPNSGEALSPAQLHGLDCVRCGRVFAPGDASVPAGLGDRGQLFAHPECADHRQAIPHPEIAPAANVGLFLAWVLTNHPAVRPGDVFDVAFANRNLPASVQWGRLDGACKELQDLQGAQR